MEGLRVRLYNVEFGDAILLSFPEKEGSKKVLRHALIDVGNVFRGEGADDDVFRPIVEDILDNLGGRRLDLYVMTHEHLDHVQGLHHAAEKWDLLIQAEYAWLTASAETDYYQRFPDARRRLTIASETYRGIRDVLRADDDLPEDLAILLANNDRLLADKSVTGRCVEHLRHVAPKTFYVHRGASTDGAHPFTEANISLWAPEEDTSDYYGRFSGSRFQAFSFPAVAGEDGDGDLIPPPGVDAGAFFDLIESRASGSVDNLLAIDKAANNSSVVFCLNWRGWKLLFPGDAEERSWKTMNARGVLEPIHFYKVGHHGSHNGTPEEEILDKILPDKALDGRPRRAAVSTCAGAYNGVPDEHTLDALRARCDEVLSTTSVKPGQYIDVEFD